VTTGIPSNLAEDVVLRLHQATGFQPQPDDISIASRLIRTYKYKDVIGAIAYVHKADPSRWWVDKVICMVDLEKYMPTLQKKVIGYRLKNKARVAPPDDPLAKKRSFWANDIGGERFRDEVQRRFISQLPCPDCCPGCEGEHKVMSQLTGMRTLFCPACKQKKEEISHALQAEIDGILV